MNASRLAALTFLLPFALTAADQNARLAETDEFQTAVVKKDAAR